MMYMTLPDGNPVPRLSALLPHIINPEALTDAELTALGVARCEITRATLEWWQVHGAPTINTEVRPVTISYPAEDLPLEDVKALAWQRIKDERETRQSGLMPYVFPGDVAGNVEMTERAKADLTAQTTAAVGLIVAGIPGNLIWTSFENITHTLTPAEMLALGLAGGQWVAAIHAESQTIRAQINAATDVQGVVAAAVWPG